MQEIIYIISIKETIAQYWCKKNNLDRSRIKIITRKEKGRGINFKKENTIVMLGKDYDYPESNPYLTHKEKLNFYELLDIVKRRIKLNS